MTRPTGSGAHRAAVRMGLLLRAGLLLQTSLLASACCSTAEQITDRGDLDVAVSRHHVDLRWGRVPNAARFVHPDLQATFIEDWSRRLQNVRITDIEILHVIELGNGVAEVTVNIIYIDERKQSLRQHTSTERWELTDGQWIMTRVADLDDSA